MGPVATQLYRKIQLETYSNSCTFTAPSFKPKSLHTRNHERSDSALVAATRACLAVGLPHFVIGLCNDNSLDHDRQAPTFCTDPAIHRTQRALSATISFHTRSGLDGVIKHCRICVGVEI